MISQNLFDETLLENQDVFEYTDDQAVKETMDEFFQQKQRLEHISLTHPLSSKGKRDRELQRRFVNSLVVENNIDVATLILKGLQQNHQQQQQQHQSPITQERQDNEKDKIIEEEEEEEINNGNNDDGDGEEKNNHQRIILSLWHLLLHNNIWTKLIDSVATVANDNNNDNDNAASLSTTTSALIDFVVALFPDSSLSLHPLAHDLKKIISPFWFEENNRNRNRNVDVDNDNDETTKTSVCYHLLEESVAAAPTTTTIIDSNNNNNNKLPLSLVQMARILCNGCEDNKKSFVKAGIERCQQIDNKTGLELLVDCLGDGNNIDFGDGTSSSSSSSSSSELSSSFLLARETCRLFAVLSKYQPLAEPIEPSAKPGAAPLVSSAHANVKEFHKTGVLPRLHKIAKGCLQQLRQDNADTNNDVDVVVVVPVNETADDDDNDDVDRNYIHYRQELLCESLSALRTMAIDNDIVQNMIALGILDTVRNSLEVVVQVATAMTSSSSSTFSPADTTVPSSLLILPSSSLALATATLGLVRNLCANDEVKTTICKSSLPCILQVMQHFLDDDKGVPDSQQVQQQQNKGEQIVQSNNTVKESRRTNSHAILEEHACGILAAMALRQPQNAHAIVEGDGHVLIFQAMRAFPFKVTLQRQACLAVRNIASRLESDVDKTKLLDAGAEDVLLSIAGSHPASSEEAYAALRDLGLTPDIFKLDEYGKATRSTTESFGTVKSNFRPIYE